MQTVIPRLIAYLPGSMRAHATAERVAILAQFVKFGGLVRHQFHPVRLAQRGTAHQPGDAAHIDDIWLHHGHPGVDHVVHPGQGVGLLAGGNRDV